MRLLICCLLLLSGGGLHAQTDIFVNMGAVDGIDLRPDNLFNFQIQSTRNQRTHALVQGTIRFRKSDLRIAYRFESDLQPGANVFNAAAVNTRLEYSSPALKELFERYQKLPQGIYEYCISVKPDYNQNESVPGNTIDECVYHKSEDIFLINLIDPEDDAKLYEYNPMLSWTVNYPFASALTYRIRVADIKEGQNKAGAISRNNPVYEEQNLKQMSIVYPVYGKPLQKNQPYAWTVDAYYKGLLLGGAEPWKFTIIEDSLMTPIPTQQSYYEIGMQQTGTRIYAIDTLKLKYKNYSEEGKLVVLLLDKDNKEVNYKTAATGYALRQGMNYIDLDFPDKASLKHLKSYLMMITTPDGHAYRIPFTYVNPLYLKP